MPAPRTCPDQIRQIAGFAPFTVAGLREMIRSHAGRYCVPPDRELAKLAALLNMIDSAYKNSANLMLAADARYALWVLMRFFDAGQQEREITEIDPRIARLVNEMEAHARAVGMNAGGLMQPYKTWRGFALCIAHAIKLAMEESNPGIGISKEGPIARLTAEAIGQITGRTPRTGDVGQFLKQPQRKKPR
jgi:hypothetical protein